MVHKLMNMGTSVELFWVGVEEVEEKVREMNNEHALVPVKGTIKMHKFISSSLGTIKHQDIACLWQKEVYWIVHPMG